MSAADVEITLDAIQLPPDGTADYTFTLSIGVDPPDTPLSQPTTGTLVSVGIL